MARASTGARRLASTSAACSSLSGTSSSSFESPGRPTWWLLLFLLPVVNIVVGVIVYIDLAKAFGKGVGFALGLLFLGIVFLPILGFGGARYHGRPTEAAGPLVQ